MVACSLAVPLTLHFIFTLVCALAEGGRLSFHTARCFGDLPNGRSGRNIRGRGRCTSTMSRVWRTERVTARVLGLACAVLVIGGACGGTRTLLSIDFDDEPVGQPPAIQQEVGTLRLGLEFDLLFGRVRVEHTPTGGFQGNWMQLTQAGELSPPAAARGIFVAAPGFGHYLITMQVVIPS